MARFRAKLTGMIYSKPRFVRTPHWAFATAKGSKAMQEAWEGGKSFKPSPERGRVGAKISPLQWALCHGVSEALWVIEKIREGKIKTAHAVGDSLACWEIFHHYCDSMLVHCDKPSSQGTRLLAHMNCALSIVAPEFEVVAPNEIGQSVGTHEEKLAELALLLESIAGVFPSELYPNLAPARRYWALALHASRHGVDAVLAQRICDARMVGKHDQFVGGQGDKAQLYAARAGKIIGAHRPSIDLACDAKSMDPAAIEFAISAGALPEQASEEPLVALCQSVFSGLDESEDDWLSPWIRMSLQGGETEDNQMLCASILARAGSSCLRQGSRGKSAKDLCQESRQRHMESKDADKSRAVGRWFSGTAGIPIPLMNSSWLTAVLGGLGLVGNGELPNHGLMALVEHFAEREALSIAVDEPMAAATRKKSL